MFNIPSNSIVSKYLIVTVNVYHEQGKKKSHNQFLKLLTVPLGVT